VTTNEEIRCRDFATNFGHFCQLFTAIFGIFCRDFLLTILMGTVHLTSAKLYRNKKSESMLMRRATASV